MRAHLNTVWISLFFFFSYTIRALHMVFSDMPTNLLRVYKQLSRAEYVSKWII